MNFGVKSAHAAVALSLVGLLCSACGKDSKHAPSTAPRYGMLLGSGTAPIRASAATPVQASATVSSGENRNGAAGQMPAFYDGRLFTVNMKQLPDSASASTIANNANLNTIYATNDLDDEQDFTPVISAIQGDGFNPLWRQVLIVFNQGVTPRQLVSEEEVLAAAAGANPEITLVVTDEVYRCAVVGSK
jgi:hypothetical protein